MVIKLASHCLFAFNLKSPTWQRVRREAPSTGGKTLLPKEENSPSKGRNLPPKGTAGNQSTKPMTYVIQRLLTAADDVVFTLMTR